MLLRARRWALQELEPSHPGRSEHSPARQKSIFHFLLFLLGKGPLRPPLPAWSLAQSGSSLCSVGRAGHSSKAARAGLSVPPRPRLPSVPEVGAPAGFDTLGEERFLAALLSGALRQGSFPAPAASPSLPSPELGLAEAASEGAGARRHAPAGPRPDRCRRRLCSHGRAPRLRPEDQQVNLGRGTRRGSRRESRGALPARPRRRVGVATR